MIISAHIGQEVKVYYRWHPLYGRHLRRFYSEKRVAGQYVHVEVAPGDIIALSAWMLDPVACVGMEIGAPRAAAGALIALHQLLIERGFRRSFLDDPKIAKEEQNGQFTEAASNKQDAIRRPASVQHDVRFRQKRRSIP